MSVPLDLDNRYMRAVHFQETYRPLTESEEELYFLGNNSPNLTDKNYTLRINLSVFFLSLYFLRMLAKFSR